MSRKGVRIVRLFYFPDSRLIWEFLLRNGFSIITFAISTIVRLPNRSIRTYNFINKPAEVNFIPPPGTTISRPILRQYDFEV